AFRLLEIAPPAPAFERRQDAPFVGRRQELGVLRKALRDAKAASYARLVAILGPAGIGKSRLAFELARRAKDVTVLSGRCLPYGEGITYWPLREVVREAPASKERDAVLTALDAETPPPAPEIAWIFRQLCEALAREKPLILVFDDVHWAEPTFLELVEQLADRGDAPILVVCVAREELVEEHPEFLADRAGTSRGARRARIRQVSRGGLPLPPRAGTGGGLPRGAKAPPGGAARTFRGPARPNGSGSRRARRVRRLPPRAGPPIAYRTR